MRLIDADALMRCIPNEDITSRFAVENAPTIEAEPVKHGKWQVNEAFKYKDMTCTACGWLFEYYNGLEEDWNYCPHCGAKMIPTIPKEIIDAVLGEDEVEE